MKNLLIALLFLLLSNSAQAAKSFELTVAFGERKTHFKIWEEKQNEYYTYYRGSGKLVQVPLSEKNFDYLFKRALIVSRNKSNDLKLCRRQTISMVITDANIKNVKGCIGSKTVVARELTQLANLLDKLNI